MTVAYPRGNDPANYVVTRAAIGVNDGQCDAVCQPYRNDPSLAVVAKVIEAFESCPTEDERREREVDVTFDEVAIVRDRIPDKTHEE